MQDRSCKQQAPPLSLIMRETYPSENNTPAGTRENTSEDSSSYELFYDSLSDIRDGDFANELSAFLSEDEISRSLELAHKSITNSPNEDESTKQEFKYYFNTTPNSSEDDTSRETRDQDTSKMTQATIPNPLLISAQLLPEKKSQNAYPNTYQSEANNVVSETGKQLSISPLLPARPSFIRSLKSAKRSGPSMQKMSSKSKPISAGNVPFKDKFCDKAATLIEELSSIFQEAAKTRVRSPDGNSSSPDSGYLSPKNKQSASRTPALDKTCLETTPENKILEVTHAEEPVLPKEEDCQASENAPMDQVTTDSHHPPSPPRFLQKLRSQEVAEGSRVLLECRVAGNPAPHVR